MPFDFLNKYKNKKIGFVGLGVSNLPVLEMMRQNGIDVTLRDKKQPEEDFGVIPCFFGENYLENINEDMLFLAPVLRPDLPELAEAKKNGVIITSEMQEFFSLSPAKIIAVTGSDGKTTTTTLIAELLRTSGKRVLLGGNIGKNLFCRLPEITIDDIAVCELSSFQLMKLSSSPYGAVVTNLSPNHLDWHTDFDEYGKSKLNILKFQNKDGFCVLNADDPHYKMFSDNAAVRIINTSKNKEKSENYYDSHGVYYKNTLIVENSDILLPGWHNRANICQAVATAAQFADPGNFAQIIKSFGGVEHRCQFIREVSGVRYYNSSIDSSPTRTAAALSSFDKKVIVIAGGYDKKIPLEPLGELFCAKTKAAVLMGSTADEIEGILKSHNYSGIIRRTDRMEEAVGISSKLAEEGDTVILSPAAASFGLFKNFEERGKAFTQSVNGLKNK